VCTTASTVIPNHAGAVMPCWDDPDVCTTASTVIPNHAGAVMPCARLP
jgi:hypothetical protein